MGDTIGGKRPPASHGEESSSLQLRKSLWLKLGVKPPASHGEESSSLQLRKSLLLKLGVKPGKVSFAERVSRVASTTGPPLNLLEQERRDRAKATKRDAHRMSESLATNFIKALSDNIAFSSIEEQMHARENPWKSFWHGSLMPNSHLSTFLDVCALAVGIYSATFLAFSISFPVPPTVGLQGWEIFTDIFFLLYFGMLCTKAEDNGDGTITHTKRLRLQHYSRTLGFWCAPVRTTCACERGRSCLCVFTSGGCGCVMPWHDHVGCGIRLCCGRACAFVHCAQA
jgi:hypothetical protein